MYPTKHISSRIEVTSLLSSTVLFTSASEVALYEDREIRETKAIQSSNYMYATKWFLSIILIIASFSLQAQGDSQEDLSQQATNPLVDQMSRQFQNNLNINKGYDNRAPIVTADLTADPDDRWIVPVGAGAGKVVILGGKLPVNLQTQLYKNVVRSDFGPEWQWRFQLQILLPKNITKLNNIKL